MQRRLAERAYAFPALIGAVVLALLNTAVNPTFASPENWAPVLATAVPFVLVAIAQTPAVLAGNGGLDLSVGPLAGLVNAVIVGTLIPRGIDAPLSVLAVVFGLGVASGLLNGVLIAVVRVPPIIATLGTFLTYQGLTLHVLPTAGGMAPDWIRALAASVGPVPGPLILPAFIAVVWLFLARTTYRRNLLALGGDERAAYTAGVDTVGVRIAAYVLAGVFAALAGLAFTAVLGSGDPTVGAPYTLLSVAGVALGGVALAGGRGGLLGAAAGGAVLFLVQNLLTLVHVSIFYLQIAYGLTLIVALALNTLGERTRRRRLTAIPLG